MKPTIIDNFAPDALAVREAVIAEGFKTEQGPDGAMYTGISQYSVPLWPKLIEQYLHRPIVPKLSCFRLNLEGELPHSWVHSDDICAKWASVLYLNLPEQCRGGTAFWKNKESGMDALPSRESLGEQVEEVYRQVEKDWKNATLWEKTGMVPMRWNRFLTYPTKYFHSRFPWEAFGKGPSDGRLIWICFYDVGSL